MFEDLVEALSTLDKDRSVSEVNRLVAEGVDPFTVIEKGLMRGMEIVGENFEAGNYFLPELLLSGKIVEACSAIVKPLLVEGQSAEKGSIVVGTVAGDIHDLGKNIIATTLESAGYRVVDLGVDVPLEDFVQTVRREKASLVAMSALLTVTMVEMERVIAALRANPELAGVKVLVGGAPLDDEFARRIGADGYGENTKAALVKVRELMEG